MTIGERIKILRESNHLTQSEVAKFLHTQKQTIYKYENGIITNIPYDKIVLASKLFAVSPAYLMGWSEPERHVDPEENPCVCYDYHVIEKVAAGHDSEAIGQETGDFEQIPLDWLGDHRKENFFVLRVKGDFMYPDLKEGDHVLVRKQSSVDNGAIVVLVHDNNQEAIIRQVKYAPDKSWVELVPINPMYPSKRIEGDKELASFHIIGEIWRLIRVVK